MLNTPIIKIFGAFDPSYSYNIRFTYSGEQVIKNQAIIEDVSNGETVYNQTIPSYTLLHAIPSNALEAGKLYSIKIKVFSVDDESFFSDPVIFKCLSTPQFYFHGLSSDGNTIISENITIKLIYSQDEGEPINDLFITLYDFQKRPLETKQYFDTSFVEYTFIGLSNQTNYYLRACGNTLHELTLDTEYIPIYIETTPIQPGKYIIANNNACDGYINIRTTPNSPLSLDKTDTIVLRRRKKDTQNWVSIYQKEILKISDLNIEFNDFTCENNKTYDYMLISYAGGQANEWLTDSAESIFNGIYISDSERIIGTEFDTEQTDTTHNIETSTINMLNQKYATVIHNGATGYDSGSASGVFMRIGDSLQSNNEMRKDIIEWLSKPGARVLKTYDGKAWLISVNGAISDTKQGNMHIRQISFPWVEIGDLDSSRDLSINGISNVSEQYW